MSLFIAQQNAVYAYGRLVMSPRCWFLCCCFYMLTARGCLSLWQTLWFLADHT